MFEERIERLSRPPPLFPLSLGARSWHDKSGDSGISGDAGAGNEDSFDVSTINRAKTTVTRPTWTPQQDLGEESSSDAGVDSPPPLSTPMKYRSPRGHVFSLSLPRDEARASMCLCPPEAKTRDAFAFNSLQKLKRSVSGAFGIGSHDHTTHRKYNNTLDDNWLLSTSAPTSLQHPRLRLDTAPPISPTVCRPFSHRRVPAACPCDSENDDNDGDDDDDEDDAGDDGYVRGIVYGACVVYEPSPPTSLTTRLHRPIVSPRHPVIILIRSCVSFVHRVTLVPPGIRSGIRPKKKRGSSLIT